MIRLDASAGSDGASAAELAPPDAPAPVSREGVDVALRDGSTVHVRAWDPSDRDALLGFLQGLSERSRWLRFFSGAVDLSSYVEREGQIERHGGYGLIATAGPEAAIVGHASYVRESASRAEIAFAIADELQGHGLATILLAHLAETAARNGIETFSASVLPENHLMIEVFRESGFPVHVSVAADVLSIELPTLLTAEGTEHFERRDQVTSIAAVRTVLAPRSVAVVGASRRRGTIGGELLHNLLEAGFQGVVHPVNPYAEAVQAVRAYPSVSAIPAPVELAVIAVPADRVLDAARDCGQAGVRSLVVISAGFAEASEAGSARQHELVAICRAHGMRLVGPNCLGVFSTAPDVRLNATFMPRSPTPGHVGFLSQSGGLGIAIVDAANDLGLGLSSFVSVGNKADLSANDFIQFWEADEATTAILLYLESFGNARKFARLARRIGRSKPIAAVKSGRSAAGARATSSHTGALLAASDVTVDALFQQAGVVRTDTLGELFDVAALLSCQPPPAGDRVAIITNAGGPGILCADACETSGLEVAELPAALRERLAEFLPGEAALNDPVDMIATATAEDYRRAVEAVGRSGAADAIIAIFIPPLVTEASDVARAIHAAAQRIPPEITLASVFMAAGGPPAELRDEALSIPVYAFPENAARALGHATRYGLWRDAPPGTIPGFDDVRPDEAAAVIAHALAGGGGWLAPAAVASLLDCYGIALVTSRLARTAAQAGREAAALGGEVALKAIAPGLLHKTDAGAVRLGLRGEREVQRVARAMARHVRAAGHEPQGFLVQPMASPGTELLVGVVGDRTFGPVLACGAGGTTAELVSDVAVRITPLTDTDAREMLASLSTYPLLRGYRGAPLADIAAVEELLLRVSAFVEHHPEVVEMDLNPVIVGAHGALAVDARVRIAPSAPDPPTPSLPA